MRAARLPLPCAPAAPSPSPAAGRSSADEGLDQGDDEHGEQDELGEEAAADESEGNVPRGDARHLLRRNAEARQPRADVHLGYLTELYTSPRFAGIPPGDRYAVLMHVTRHYLSHIVRNGGALPREPAPFLRKHRTGNQLNRYVPMPWPDRLTAALLRAPRAVTAERLPSRRTGAQRGRDTSPASTLTPAVYGVLKGKDQRPRAALLGEADAHLSCVLGQYDDDAGERADRCHY